jgi:tryptophanyl-tRNA synthetase
MSPVEIQRLRVIFRARCTISECHLTYYSYRQTEGNPHLATASTANLSMADEPGQPPALTTLSLAEQASSSHTIEQRITPFDVSGGVDESGKLLPVDYNKLIQQFGAMPISPTLLERFEKVTGKKPHRFLRRGIVFSHRDLEKILDRHEMGQPFYLYTGRGPSSGSLHVGHSIPFEFTKYGQ